MKHTPKEIAELLKERPHQPHYIEWLVKKAIEEEREACAKICDGIDFGEYPDGDFAAGLAWECAEEIRARSNAELRGR
jgi:hypothetical protein